MSLLAYPTGEKKPENAEFSGFSKLVPRAGLEPARCLAPADFESAASTNFATQAVQDRDYGITFRPFLTRLEKCNLYCEATVIRPNRRPVRNVAQLRARKFPPAMTP